AVPTAIVVPATGFALRRGVDEPARLRDTEIAGAIVPLGEVQQRDLDGEGKGTAQTQIGDGPPENKAAGEGDQVQITSKGRAPASGWQVDEGPERQDIADVADRIDLAQEERLRPARQRILAPRHAGAPKGEDTEAGAAQVAEALVGLAEGRRQQPAHE